MKDLLWYKKSFLRPYIGLIKHTCRCIPFSAEFYFYGM